MLPCQMLTSTLRLGASIPPMIRGRKSGLGEVKRLSQGDRTNGLQQPESALVSGWGETCGLEPGALGWALGV